MGDHKKWSESDPKSGVTAGLLLLFCIALGLIALVCVMVNAGVH